MTIRINYSFIHSMLFLFVYYIYKVGQWGSAGRGVQVVRKPGQPAGEQAVSLQGHRPPRQGHIHIWSKLLLGLFILNIQS